jgi:hypothetical protein
MAISRYGSVLDYMFIVLPLTQHQAANILVDDDTRCNFGQSEMRLEVYRISRTPVPRKFDVLPTIFPTSSSSRRY